MLCSLYFNHTFYGGMLLGALAYEIANAIGSWHGRRYRARKARREVW